MNFFNKQKKNSHLKSGYGFQMNVNKIKSALSQI